MPTTVKKKRGKARSKAPTARQGTAPSARVPAGATTLGRVLDYGEKVFGLCTGLRTVKDGRRKARVPAGRVALSFLLLLLARLGSLNALEQRTATAAWAKWLGGPLPSADVMGASAKTLDLEGLRAVLRRQHRRLKANKGFGRDRQGLRYLILDGHEGIASYRRSWKECLARLVRFANGDRPQYYFRYVCAYLTNGRQRLLLDAERQLPGEGEIACARRLLTRVFVHYPRAFDVVAGDNLYMDPAVWKLVRTHRKHCIAVLKNNSRDLLTDARALFDGRRPLACDSPKVRRVCWDLDDFTTWPQCGEPVRVVRTVETTTAKRQHDKQKETRETEWFWVTSLPPWLADTQTVVRAGHGRWDIENHGFNELANHWHGDHGYTYHAHALLACTLLLFIAYNLFHAFLDRNLKPQAKACRTIQYWVDLITAEFILTFHRANAPP